MANLIKEVKLVLSKIEANNNKFWYIELYDDASTITRNGRIGQTGAVHPKTHNSQYSAERFTESKIAEKRAKGYTDAGLVGAVGDSVQPVSNLQAIAQSQIKTNNSIVSKLIHYFTQVNAHNITSATGGQITFSDTTGLFSTPLGIVGQGNIDNANRLLVDIGNKVANLEYDFDLEELTNRYMMFVPQNIGMRRVDTRDFWGNVSAVQKQKAIVDSLQASLVQVTTAPITTDSTPTEQVFDVQLDLVDDPKVMARIRKLYEGTKNGQHVCSHLKVKKVYAVTIASERQAFKNDGKALGNVKKLWHGTRASNVLSILKGGLVIPPSSSSHCTGRAFGDGLYFSDQSSKSLNYSYGYWRGGNYDDNCFMFLADVAMGKEYVPKSRGGYYPVDGHDSTFCKGGTVFMNNEMIVYKKSQANLKYLVEFKK